MRVPNEPEREESGEFAQLLQIQTEFYTRLADETLKYLRRIQGAAMPASPGTVMMPGGSELRASGLPGTAVELKLEVENRQRVHCVVTPMLSPLFETSGVAWFPAVEPVPATILLAPEQIAPLLINVALPAEIPAGIYRGMLQLHGFRDGVVAVAIEVMNGTQSQGAGSKTPRSRNKRGASAGKQSEKTISKKKKGRSAKRKS